jgi:hypothetical protein
MSHLQQSTFEVDKSGGGLMLLWRELSAIGAFARNDSGKSLTIICPSNVMRGARELIEKYSYPENVTADNAGGRSDDLPNYDEDPPEPQREEVAADDSPVGSEGPTAGPDDPTTLDESPEEAPRRNRRVRKEAAAE